MLVKNYKKKNNFLTFQVSDCAAFSVVEMCCQGECHEFWYTDRYEYLQWLLKGND